MFSVLRHPSAWIPILIPLLFLAYLVIVLATAGVPVREADEGVGAHLFQLWLLLEPFMVGFFALRWLPRAQREASIILALQVAAAFIPIYIVFSLNL